MRPALRRRGQLVVFGAVVAGLTLAANLYARSVGANTQDIAAAPVGGQVALYAQAAIPAIGALVAWACGRQRPEWGFRRTTWSSLGVGWVIGVLAVVVAYAAAWSTGAAEYSSTGLSQEVGMPAPAALAVALLPGVLPWMALALGEELGWNSFLLARLRERHGPDASALLLGLAWAAFHLPLILLVPGAVADGVPTAFAALVFTVELLALAFPLVWLRLRTGSIWPALVLHGSFNSALYLFADPASEPTGYSGWFVGEGGLLVAAGTVLTVALTIPLWRQPGHLPPPSPSYPSDRERQLS